MLNIFTTSGALGLILISIGVITKKRKAQDFSYILGGVFLIIYSIYIKDIIFISLQIMFTASAIYDISKR